MSEGGHPALSVVVCCYSDERWPLLVRAVDAVGRQLGDGDELLVVVDHNEELLAKLAAHRPWVRVLRNSDRPGLSGARNTGVRHARGDVVAFLDDDAVPEPGWAQHLLAPYAEPLVLGVGGRIVPDFAGAPPSWLPPELDWVVGCTYAGHRPTMGPVRNLIGANMSFRRTALAEAGGFRSDLGRTGDDGAGCEETELCIRITRDRPGVIWYEPQAIVVHHVPPARATPAYLRARCRAEGASKARIAALAGADDGLASERRYVFGAFPRALGREAAAGILGHRPGAWSRLRTLMAASAMVAAGYGRARLRHIVRGPGGDDGDDAFEPLLVVDVDVDAPAPIAPRRAANGDRYRRAMLLVRQHGAPSAVLEAPLPDGGLSSADVDALLAPVRTMQAAQPTRLATHRRPPAEPPFVSVIVATCGAESQVAATRLAGTIESLQRQTYDRYEVVIVDNRPAQVTATLVRRLAESDSRIRYVAEARPGLARAHNRGLQVAAGSIVAFTDDDVVADDHWLESLVTAFGDDERIACVTGMILPLEIETRSQRWIEETFGFGKGFLTRRFELADAERSDPLFPYAAGRFGSGANMAFRADVLRAIGGFDPALGAGTPARGGDDLAGFFDVVSRGHALVYEPTAVVRHGHRRDFAALRRQAFGYGVGLGAYLSHVVCTQPAEALRATRRVPAAVRHFLAPGSPRNARRPADYPRALTWSERAGVLAGPWHYAQSRRMARHDGWDFDGPSPARVLPSASAARAES